MSEFNAEEFIHNMKHDNTADVDAAFAALSKELPETEYKAAVDAIETELLSEIKEDIDEEGGIEGFKKEIKEQIANDPDYKIEDLQSSFQMVLNISRVKGDAASPPVKAFVAAAAKLTDAEYNSKKSLLKPLIAFADTAVPSKPAKPKPIKLKAANPQPNPFRKP